MKLELEAIRDEQKMSWNKFAPGWRMWNDLVMDFWRPMGDAIIQKLNLKDKSLVLDVASGTGEPGLTIASNMKRGKVVISDISEDMLSIARENAARRGITNIESLACDACKLPFFNNTFDAISCRFGFMFFPDLLLAAKEMLRVLKRGGRIAAAVWDGPEKNLWMTIAMAVIRRNILVPETSSGAPGIFRCAGEGQMVDIFHKAGLRNVTVRKVAGKFNCRTADVYWNVMNEISAPVAEALSRASNAVRMKIRTQIYHAINLRYPEGDIKIDSAALVVCGEK